MAMNGAIFNGSGPSTPKNNLGWEDSMNNLDDENVMEWQEEIRQEIIADEAKKGNRIIVDEAEEGEKSESIQSGAGSWELLSPDDLDPHLTNRPHKGIRDFVLQRSPPRFLLPPFQENHHLNDDEQLSENSLFSFLSAPLTESNLAHINSNEHFSLTPFGESLATESNKENMENSASTGAASRVLHGAESVPSVDSSLHSVSEDGGVALESTRLALQEIPLATDATELASKPQIHDRNEQLKAVLGMVPKVGQPYIFLYDHNHELQIHPYGTRLPVRPPVRPRGNPKKSQLDPTAPEFVPTAHGVPVTVTSDGGSPHRVRVWGPTGFVPGSGEIVHPSALEDPFVGPRMNLFAWRLQRQFGGF